ncbi:MAG: Holliday junction branch migration protein RuvA [Bacteroidales bacterium]|nr:Holliday junction branch migration protein RuvA [Bacteroidales bacterium]
MYDYIKGKIEEINPAELILECGGIGYSINISLQTYETLQGKDSAKIYVFHYIREDEESFYGFATKDERELFKLLISVNGVGVGSARMMLSSLSDEEIRNAIIGENVARIKSVKGIGLKTAQRIILDLKDKIVKGGGTAATLPTMTTNNANVEEATIALTMLGFSKVNINKVIPDIIKKNPDAKVEDIIKEALKKL